MITKAISCILPDEVLFTIIEYIKPIKLDNRIQDEIKSEFVFRLFTQYYKDFLNNIDEIEKRNQLDFHVNKFEYYIMSLPLEDYRFYIEQLKKHKNKKKCNYFIKIIERVIGINQQRDFYDDDEYDEYEEYEEYDEYYSSQDYVTFQYNDLNYIYPYS